MTGSMLTRITPLILTLNEEANIRRTLSRLSWAQDVVVVDSGSTDATLNILREFPKVRVFTRTFTTHAEQWTYGLETTGMRTEWVLALDADYVLADELVGELAALDPDPGTAGYRVSFKYCIEGKPLRCGVYPPVVALFRRDRAKYVQDGHTHRVVVDGVVNYLNGLIYHDDRKPMAAWIAAQARYMKLEAQKLLETPYRNLTWADRLRSAAVAAPPVMFFYCLLVRGGLLDGIPGLFYALQRSVAEGILGLYLLQARCSRLEDRLRNHR